MLEFLKYCVCDQIGKLDHPRCAGVKEERYLGQIPQYAPTMTNGPKIGRKGLNCCLVRGLVKDDYAPLGVVRFVEPCKVLVKATGKLFKGKFNRINWRNSVLSNDDSESSVTWI